MDTYTTLWNRLLLRAPGVGASLAQDLVRDAFNQLAERREWSWLQKSSAFYPASYTPQGTISVTSGTFTVTGSGTAFTTDMVGKQFRSGLLTPTYTITQVPSPSTLVLDKPWAGPDLTDAAYTVFQCYFPVPADFGYFVSLVNANANYQLHTNFSLAEVDRVDPQRTTAGNPYVACFYDTTPNYAGKVGSVVHVSGPGPAPIATTSYGYTFPADSLYTIIITQEGPVGAGAEFAWSQDGGPLSPPIPTSSDPTDLSNGVQVYFPEGSYRLGATFAVQCQAQGVSGVPRYELWPRPIGVPYVFPYIYSARIPDLSDESPALPPFIASRGDVVLEMALAAAARFPGTEGQKNPYYDLALADRHERKAEIMLNELEKKDDNIAIRTFSYQRTPYAPNPFGDGTYQQSHAPFVL